MEYGFADALSEMMQLRKTRKALQEGTVRFRSQGDLFVMERQLQEELLVTVINNTDCPQNYTLSGNYVLRFVK